MLPTQKIESILYVSNKPLSVKRLAEICESTAELVEQSISLLQEKYNTAESGVRILRSGNDIQFATSPEVTDIVETFLKQELTGEMTKPQLETLTIVAYRGPIAKLELEQIRGVNCSLILRNLLIRGLIEQSVDLATKQSVYQITIDFLRFLGVDSVRDLPDYERLSRHQHIEAALGNVPQTEPADLLEIETTQITE